ncbi:MAG TPA: electron transfer flavoprotein subunit alpha [Anaerovoracaceae bacterium]|nr:electron transfer flavoprotein subunit alpha [Anaerovoracaceae bacterium]
MKRLICHQDKVNETNREQLIAVCSFHAIEDNNGVIEITAGCKMCMLCVKNGPEGVMELVEEETAVDKGAWRGVAVYVDHAYGEIHPVTMELIGKARELADKVKEPAGKTDEPAADGRGKPAAAVDFPVYCVFMGHGVGKKAEELLHYGVDEVFVYDEEELRDFRIEPYAAAFEDFIRRVRPSSVLVGATTMGRSLAPRVAARFGTGLTADCTKLEMKENTDLVQIRPAFGGNIMAQILCTKTRPQMATVRYKVMSAPVRSAEAGGKITRFEIDKSKLASRIEVLKVAKKPSERDISDADTIVAVGRGLKSEKDIAMVRELAELLGAQIAGTRPMIEAGVINAKQQIGLSGRTVKPKLIVTLGVSGSVQFAAGMNGSEQIFAVNSDPHASIFNIAHYGIVGDIYEIVPQLIENIKSHKAGR